MLVYMLSKISTIRAVSILLGLLSLVSTVALAGDILTFKRLNPDLAHAMVLTAVKACRAQGYQVTAVVMGRDGAAVALLRDANASRFTLQLAREKANAVILSGVSSARFRNNRRDIRRELNHVDGVLMLQGGLPIQAAGSLLGAIGVSGAPGGERDEVCAQKALDSIEERLQFAE